MERLAIIDHTTHTLFVEDIDEELLQNKYNGEEEDYIRDNYCISDTFSWDYITDAQYIPLRDETEVYEINFSEICD